VRFLRNNWGYLLIPGLAFAYGAYALWELTTGPFREATIIYTYVIAIPMLILGAISLIGDLRRPGAAGDSAEKEAGERTGAEESAAPGGPRRVFWVVVASIVLILALPYVGYVIGFFLYVLAVLWAVELRNWLAALIIAVIMTAVVHFVFAGLLGQDLPIGPLTFLET
jgi:hypothetical protein